MKKSNFCAAIDSDFNNELQALKDTLGLSSNAEVLHALVSFYKEPFKSGLSTPQKIERFVKSELINPTQKINTNTAQNWFKTAFGSQPNINTMKEVFALYSVEIEAHNAKF